MAKTEILSTGAEGRRSIPPKRVTGNSSRATPDEGVRLIHAFTSVKRPVLREAIVTLVAAPSEPHEKGL